MERSVTDISLLRSPGGLLTARRAVRLTQPMDQPVLLQVDGLT